MIASQKIGKSFMGALGYNLRKLNHPDNSQRAELLGGNFARLDPGLIKKEVELVRNLRPGLSRYVYHTSLNFSKEDEGKLDNRKLLAIAQEYLLQSGFENNQYLVFRHHDADHPHLHLLANRIGFDGKVVSDSNNFKKSEALLRKLEVQYGLTPVAPSHKATVKAVKKGELEMVIRTGKPSDKMILQELLKEITSGQGQKESQQGQKDGQQEQRDRQHQQQQQFTLPELIEKGEQAGISFLFNQATTGKVTGITYFYGNFKAKGQALGNQFKWAEIIKRVSYEQIRDSQAISQANSRTTDRYGSAERKPENLASSGRALYRTASGKAGTGRRGLADANQNTAADATEFSLNPETGARIGADPAADIDDMHNAGDFNPNPAAAGRETAMDDAAMDSINDDQQYAPAFPVPIEIAYDEDDALKRRRKRGR